MQRGSSFLDDPLPVTTSFRFVLKTCARKATLGGKSRDWRPYFSREIRHVRAHASA
jgi:hypothetical protein